MTDIEIIVKQVREIERLKADVEFYKTAKAKIAGIIYNMGAPLNDNILKYSNEQLVLFVRIAESLDIR